MVKLKAFGEMFKEKEIGEIVAETGAVDNEIDFEGFLRVSYFDNSCILSQYTIFFIFDEEYEE